MIENLYILGAGASADAGAPLMNNFIDTAEDLLNENAYRKNKNMQELFDNIKSLNSLHAKSKIDLNNIEAVLGLLEMYELLEFPNRIDSSKFKSLKKTYIEFIAETIELSMKFNITSTKKINSTGSYPIFASHLSKHRENTAIITFNYDLGIDVALYNAGIDYNYYLNKIDSKFPLLKLHGSLNWFEEKNHKVTPHYLSSFFEKTDLIKSSSGIEKGTLTFYNYIKENYPNKYQTSIPFIIPPTWNKTMYHNSVSNVWHKASICLSEARNIYVIGYSLPETDAFFKYLFSIGTNSKTRIRKFWVLNPERLHTQERFKNLLGPDILDRFKYINQNFAMGMRQIIK